AAIAAAVVLAADAVIVRTAASEGYFSSLMMLVLAVQVALAFAVQADSRRDRLATSLALGAAGLLAAAAAPVHPIGYLQLAPCRLVVLGAAPAQAWQTRLARTLVAATAIAAVVVASSGSTIRIALRAPMAAHAIAGLTGRDAALLLAVIAMVAGLRRWL